MKIDISKEEIQESLIRWRYTGLQSHIKPIVYVGFIDLVRKEGYLPLQAEVIMSEDQYNNVFSEFGWNQWHYEPLPDWMFEC